MATPRLKEIELPEGDVGSIGIDWPNRGAINLSSQDWLSEGYDGVRLIGKGIKRTHVRCTGHDGVTLGVGPHGGIVQLEGVSLHGGSLAGVHFGFERQRVIQRKFRFNFYESEARSDQPLPGAARPKWLLFYYQADFDLRDVVLDAYHCREHAKYGHGNAKLGESWLRVRVEGSGAQPYKQRTDASECLWAGKNVWHRIRHCQFKGWLQPWTDRGGAAIVMEGAGVNILVEDSLFWPGGDVQGYPAHQRAYCIAISSEGNSFDASTGRVDQGHGNGDVIIRRCGGQGIGYAGENGANMLRIGRNGGSQYAARSYLVDGCGWWGDRYLAELKDMPAGKITVRGCNTPEIRRRCDALGMNTTNEVRIPTQHRLVPLSEGFAA